MANAYGCDVCFKHFQSKHFLRLHKERKCCQKQKKKVSYETCEICDKKFLTKEHLESHYSRHIQSGNTKTGKQTTHQKFLLADKNKIAKSGAGDNVSEKAFTCDQCGQTFAKECSLIRHENVHAKEVSDSKTASDSQFSCTDCDLSFSKKCYVTNHWNRVHNRKQTVSPKRSGSDQIILSNSLKNVIRFPELKRWNNRKQVVQENQHSNSDAEDQISSHSSVELSPKRKSGSHELDSSGQESVADIPEETTESSAEQANSDVKDVDLSEVSEAKDQEGQSEKDGESSEDKFYYKKRPYKCAMCTETFSKKFAMEDHMRIHLDEKSFPCFVCGERFNRQLELTRHRRTHPGVKPYACRFCFKEFNDNGVLRRHVMIHTMEKNYVCEVCGDRFVDPSTLISHRANHSDERPYKCSICDATFKRANSLRVHIECVHERSTWYECNVCEKSYARKGSLVEHLKRHAGINSHFCDKCDAGFPSSSALGKHRAKHEAARFKCDICGKDFGRSYDLKIHKRIHSGERPYTCNLCEMTFVTKHNLVRHELLHSIKGSMYKIKRRGTNQSDSAQSQKDTTEPGGSEHEKSEEPYACEVCGKLFVKKHNFWRHFKEVHSTEIVECDICGVECEGAVMLKEHVKREHLVQCGLCKMQFANQDVLDNHVTAVHPEKSDDAICDICGEEFRLRSTMMRHRAKHSEPEAKTYSCEKCNASFTREGSLHVHMLSHADVIPHCCHLCDNKFYLKEALDKHIARHKKPRPIKCPVCPRKFENLSLMFRHRKIHLNVTKPYKCEICQIGFSGEVYLRRHMKRFHDEGKTNPSHGEVGHAVADGSYLNASASEENGVTLHIPESDGLQELNHAEVHYLTQYAGMTEIGKRTVTYIVVNTGEGEVPLPADHEILYGSLGDDTNLIANAEEGSVPTVVEDIPAEVSAKKIENVEVTPSPEINQTGGDNSVADAGPPADPASPLIANQVHIDHSYLSPGPKVIYVNPTDVVLGGDVDVIMEVCDSGVEKDLDSAPFEGQNPDDGDPNELQCDLDNDGCLTIATAYDVGQDVVQSGEKNAVQFVNVSNQGSDQTDGGALVLQCEAAEDHVGMDTDAPATDAEAHKDFPEDGNGKVGHECRICGSSFLSKRSLTCHFKQAHPDHSVLHCEICNRDFRSKTNYREHQFIHRGIKGDMCHICGLAFLSKSRLSKHLKRHRDTKPYQCETCGKEFKQKASLQKHSVTHGGEKRFECDICQKKFFHQNLLKEHLQRHYGIKPYKCELCEKTFVTCSNLNVHKKSHLAERKARGRPRVKKVGVKREVKGRKVGVCQSTPEGEVSLENVVTLENLQLCVSQEVVTDGQLRTMTIKPLYADAGE